LIPERLDLPIVGRSRVRWKQSDRRYAMYTLKVEKMSCGGCAARVTRAVQALDSNAKVDVLLKDRLVRVESAQALDVVVNAITSAGYPASKIAES